MTKFFKRAGEEGGAGHNIILLAVSELEGGAGRHLPRGLLGPGL